jgi:triosephosphate isomerase
MVDFRYVANLKMNGSSDQVTNWINTVSKLPKKLQEKCVFCPPVCYLESASNLIKIENYFLKLGSQNLDANLKESYTGGIAANMLRDIGCEYVIIGHSERRILAKESDDILSQKTKVIESLEDEISLKEKRLEEMGEAKLKELEDSFNGKK